MDDVLVKAAVAAGATGLVIEGSGRGNVTSGIAGTLKSLARDGFPVIITSRCPGGRVEPVYGAKGGSGGRDLEDAGCIFAGDLKGPKARILLMVALAGGASVQRIRAVFQEVAP
jgi:L-asparaginase